MIASHLITFEHSRHYDQKLHDVPVFVPSGSFIASASEF